MRGHNTSRSLFRFSLDRVTRLVRRVIPNNSSGLLVKGLHRVKSRRVKAEKSIDTAARIKRYQDGYLEYRFLTSKRSVLIARPQEKRDQDEDYGFYDWKDQNDHVLVMNEWKKKQIISKTRRSVSKFLFIILIYCYILLYYANYNNFFSFIHLLYLKKWIKWSFKRIDEE